MKLDNRKDQFAAQQHKNITTYYNIYDTDSRSHSYTVTKTCLVFSFKLFVCTIIIVSIRYDFYYLLLSTVFAWRIKILKES